MSTTYKAIVFDVGGVLISPPQEVIAQYERNINVTHGSVSSVFIGGHAFIQLERGEITLSQFVPRFDKECFQGNKDAEFPKGFSAGELFNLIASESKPNFAMLSVVDKLRKCGYKTCALTNNWIGQRNLLQSLLSGYFDVIIESCIVGLRKPDQAIYRLACERLDVQPSEVVFLDDLGLNLKSAHILGMRTIKVECTDDAIKQLEKTLQLTLTPTPKL